MEAVRQGGGRCAGTQVVISQTVFSRNSVYRRACNHCTLRQKHWTVASFSPQPFSDVVLQVKIYRKKSQHHCSNTERGEQGSAFLRGCPGTFNWDCRCCRRTLSARGRGGTSALFAHPPSPALPTRLFSDILQIVVHITGVNPILHGLFWAGWSRGGGDGIHHTFITLVLFDGFELNLVQ